MNGMDAARSRLTRTVPALPVSAMDAALEHYTGRFGFRIRHHEGGFAIVVRDDAELHLWEAGDASWRERDDLRERAVSSGAETFIAGTASCRIEVTGVEELFVEYRTTGVLYDQVLGLRAQARGVTSQPWGVRDFHTLDRDHNLMTFYEVESVVGVPHASGARLTT